MSAGMPELHQNGDGSFLFRWPEEQVEIAVERVKEGSDRTTAELTVVSTGPGSPGHLHQARISLDSTASRDTLAKRLVRSAEGVDWDSILEQTCVLALQRLREGEPVVEVGASPAEPTPFLLEPVIPLNHPAILYAPGESHKTTLCCAFALLVQSGERRFGVQGQQGNVLYLDWESDDADLNRRAALLKAGLKLTAGLVLAYRYCSQPLVQIAPELRRLVVARNVSLVVIDSLGGACGGELEAPATALTFFNALRSLRASSLINAHTPKHEAGERQRSVFGSAFFTNLARSVWEVRSSRLPGEKGYSVGLFERKRNLSKPHEPIGLYLTYGEESTIIERQDVRDDPELAASLTQPERVVAALRRGKLTTAQLAEVTDASDGAMRKVMQRLHDKHLVQRFSDGWGLATHEDPT